MNLQMSLIAEPQPTPASGPYYEDILRDDILVAESNRTALRPLYPALDGARAVAFLMVFFNHYIFLPWGWTGVNIFFVLSGFLITGILLDTRDQPHRVRNFYVRRALRIFPLYYGIFLILLLLTPLLHWEWSIDWLAWPLYLGNFLRYTSSKPITIVRDSAIEARLCGAIVLHMAPIWTLCIEEQFYLVWPWIVFRIRSINLLLWLCVSVVVATPIAREVSAHFAPSWMLDRSLLYYATPFQVDGLLLGAAIAILWRGSCRKSLLSAARIVAVAGSIAIVVLGAMLLHIWKTPAFHKYAYMAGTLTWETSLINLYCGSLILCALHPGSFVYRILDQASLCWIGRRSYGAYVFHEMFHTFYLWLAVACGKHVRVFAAHPVPLLVLFGLSGTLLLSYLSYRFYETFFLKWKDRLTLQ